MAITHVIVDGSNIATEGRTVPSLAQLDEAVRAFLDEFGHPALTVVVDATFGHRIADAEREAFEAGIVNGELVTPPAGAIGRGDAFVLQIAAKAGAVIFSNDSFQEFHGTYDWLFDEGRLIGGKPVPSVGWVFVPRTPVRGPTSRRATRATRDGRASSGGRKSARMSATSPLANEPLPVPTAPPPRQAAKKKQAAPSAQGAVKSKRAATKASAKSRSDAAEADLAEVGGGGSPDNGTDGEAGPSRGRRGRRTSSKALTPINEPIAFLSFVGDHPVGALVEATVDRFSSHGAYAVVGDAQCYIPLKAMAEPAPTKAREVLTVGEVRTFVVTSFDPVRRGIDVAVPGVGPEVTPEPSAPDLGADAVGPGSNQPAEEATTMAVTKKATAKRKTAAKKAPARKKKAAAKKAPARKATTAKKAAATAKRAATRAKKAATTAKRAASTAKKTTAKKAPAKRKAAAKKAPARKKTAAKKAPARKKAAAKKTTARKTTARKAR